ncbi:MAG: hypothetical protein ABSE73_33095 [Planctomycetota bacterium]
MAAETSGTAVNSVRIVLPDEPGPVLQKIAGILERQIVQRCAATVSTSGTAALAVELAVEPGIGNDGFKISGADGGAIRIAGDNERGVLYGIGKLLRGSRFEQGGFRAGGWRGTQTPKCPIRAVYLATHFNNFYEAAPLEDVQHYVQDLGLWGYNTIIVAYPPIQFNGLSDPAAQKWLGRFKTVLAAARQSGLQVGLLECPNQGYKNTPAELKATKVPGNFRGNFGVNLCPSKPEARKALFQLYDELLDQFKDTGLDYFGFWPYDEGGCACPQCWPWGARGFAALAKELAQHVRARFPAAKTILSTWCFENENDANPDGEWAGLAKVFASEDKSWASYLMSDGHDNYFPKYILETGVPGGLPLLNFPEISMFGMNPWGGYGANPAPAHFQRLWDRIKHKAAGGAPYSEGIYEDLNKAICAQFYWDPERKAEETVQEYAAFEFAPDAAADLLEAVRIFEQNHSRGGIRDSAVRAFELVSQSEEKMTPQARKSWRWRIFFLRALIDKEMFERKGKLAGEPLKQAFEELTRIYHAENAGPMPLKPPQVR